jgi:hypothetical protein
MPQNVTAIQITATGDEIDLNGFAILGPTACTGTPPTTDLTCAPVGIGERPLVRVDGGGESEDRGLGERLH